MLEMEEKEQQEKRPFWRINPKLVPLQFLTFIFYGGMAALYPFFTIHMKSLGFTTTETAIIYGVLPLLCFIGPAITGWAGDKIGNYKLILAIAIG
ncbi:hypothetical protein BV898_10955 [Hypsibius exemplaris]|uniref:Major facilitator superfamily associated domain-containing protein n=1 Tax=Hypsibius exemplaris TaxID=2072580 RepID=A0A1W0WI57_HYPEX|nr:hypothetical protein BV898_10955 [Hypsibius exemplaris]